MVLLLIGLSVVLATAFVQEGMGRRKEPGSGAADVPAGRGGPAADGAVRPDDSLSEEALRPTARRLFTWQNALGGGVLAFALWGVVAAGWVLFGGGASGQYRSRSPQLLPPRPHPRASAFSTS